MAVSLIDLQQWYLQNLCGKNWVFTYGDNKQIILRFTIEDFCHLTGIQYVYNGDMEYAGRAGWDKIAQGAITINGLKRINKAAYSQHKERIKYFKEIENVLKYGQIVWFNVDRCGKYGAMRSKIQAKIIFYTNDGKKVIHLFAREQGHNGFYAPVSFIIKSVKQDDPLYFIENQTKIKIKNRFTIVD